MEAKKVLKKAKQLKQLDLKGKFAKKIPNKMLSEAELAQMRIQAEQQRIKRIVDRLAEKERKKEERLARLQKQKEQRRLEKLKKIEWLKPREDQLCDDSKVLFTW